MGFTKRDLQTLFKGYKCIDHKMESALNGWGFCMQRQKNHVVLFYRVGTKNLVFTVSKSSSDKRAGLNLASIIYNTINQAVCQAA